MNEASENLGGARRREVLKGITAVAAGTAAARLALAQETAVSSRFFPGFRVLKVKTSGAEIHTLVGGEGPPVLLLHGAPQTHLVWRLVAPELASEYTVVLTDLRGYGDSSKAPDTDDHVNYSKRSMALDQVEVMRALGYEQFRVIGHDRGGRVTHRMALDHPQRVIRASVLDIIPTYWLYTHVDIEFVQAYFHWFSYLRPAPVPENELIAAAEERRRTRPPRDEVDAEFFRSAGNPENIHAMCEDYRAGASIDLVHDAADIDKRIACPLLVLWGDRGAMGRMYDVLGIWRERGVDVSGRGMPSGHDIPQGAAPELLAELRQFLRV